MLEKERIRKNGGNGGNGGNWGNEKKEKERPTIRKKKRKEEKKKKRDEGWKVQKSYYEKGKKIGKENKFIF